jgi:hypothetical protein
MFSPHVLSALEEGRKLEAIKRLREERGIGLKQAKELVEEYMEMHPELNRRHTGGAGGLVLLAVLAVISVVLYLRFGR